MGGRPPAPRPGTASPAGWAGWGARPPGASLKATSPGWGAVGAGRGAGPRRRSPVRGGEGRAAGLARCAERGGRRRPGRPAAPDAPGPCWAPGLLRERDAARLWAPAGPLEELGAGGGRPARRSWGERSFVFLFVCLLFNFKRIEVTGVRVREGHLR